MKLQPKNRRVQSFLDRLRKAPAFQWDDITDPRDPRGRRWPFASLMDGLLDGMLAGCLTLRDVEVLTDELAEGERFRIPRRIPDTTLYELVPRLSVEQLRDKLRQQVRTLWRAKSFEPQNLPCGVLSIDGKAIGTLSHDAEGSAQKAHRAHDGSPYWLSRVLRAVLTSAAAKPCLDQMLVPAETNEMGAFEQFFAALMAAYGRGDLFEIVTADAGFTSAHNAGLVHAADKAYVLALKLGQPELRAEAERLLRPKTRMAPDAETGWERVRGKLVQRRLYRTTEIAGFHDWSHLRQAWLVVQETRHPGGKAEIEERFFLTNLTSGRLSAAQCLLVVRGHWGIENDCFWSADMQWHEDFSPWCTRGVAVEVLGLLRLMAYNLLQLARKRHLRPRHPDGKLAPPPAWRQVFDWVRQALRLPPPIAVTGQLV